MITLFCRFITAALLIFISSCAAPPMVENPESEAEVVYRNAQFHYQKNNWEEAEKLFTTIIRDHSYSTYSTLAHIGLGDTFYGKENYSAALEVYKRFLKMHPDHKKADYVLFQVGNSYFEQRPTDFFLLPAPDSKDLAKVEKARAQYKRFTEKYPDSSYIDDVREKLGQAEAMLISRELRVADYYAGQNRCPGVHMRLNRIKKQFTVEDTEIIEKIKELRTDCPLTEKEKAVIKNSTESKETPATPASDGTSKDDKS